MIQGSTGVKKSELGFPPQNAFTQGACYGVLRKDFKALDNFSFVTNFVLDKQSELQDGCVLITL